MNRTLTLGIGALALAAMTIPTSAADLGRRPPPPPVMAPPVAYNWSGFYIGGNVGGKWADQDGDIFLDQVVGFTPLGLVGFGNGGNGSNGAFVGGGQIGFNWQTGAWVWGVEGDFQGTSLDRTFVCCGPLVPAFFVPGDTFSVKNDWQASFRGRLGYAWDRFMVYATGGVAFANIEATVALQPVGAVPGLFASASDTLTGWTAGGGIEFGLWDNWSLGVEYRFSSFDSSDFNHGNLPLTLITSAPLRSSIDLETHEVTARLNYRFSWWGTPAGPRY
ncbi:MAG: outer membrane protein [Xanthobacteraceae bacterium]